MSAVTLLKGSRWAEHVREDVWVSVKVHGYRGEHPPRKRWNFRDLCPAQRPERFSLTHLSALLRLRDEH